LRFRAVAGVLLLAVVVAGVVAYAGGLEFNVVHVEVPVDIVGSVQVFVAPLNVSDPGLLRDDNVYVVVAGQPRFSFLFSRNPPVVAFVEPSAYTARYHVWYGGDNPYQQFIGAPGSPQSFWLAFDEFDYDTGFWYNASTSIYGSRAYVEPGGWLALGYAYSPKTLHLWLLHGRRALLVAFPEPYTTFVALTLTRGNFTDIGQVLDGSDVYFLSPAAECLQYAVLHFDKAAGVLKVVVNPEGSTTVYMLYGSTNKCPDSRVSLG